MSDENENFVYGELILLGCNGSLPGQGDRGRRRSKFLVTRRPGPQGNGIKKARHYFVQSGAHQSKAVLDKSLHSISYTLARNEAVIVEYEPDPETDLFQIGRSSEPNIDFIVLDTPSSANNGPQSQGSSHQASSHASSSSSSSTKADPLAHNHHHHNHSHHHHSHNHHGHSHHGSSSQSTQPQPQSTISRFACRILIERNPPHTARIFAAGFDSLRNIFLGEKATKWQSKGTGEFDAFTTNGILLMHPPPNVFDRQPDSPIDKEGGESSPIKRMNLKSEDFKWREVSVNGGIYDLRETRSSSEKGNWIESESNILRDGSLIDLCGATLLWRSRDAMNKPTKLDLERMINAINATRPQCPVGLNTLFIPFGNMTKPPAISSTSLLSESGSFHEPYVYMKCGHVQGWHDWRRNGAKKKPRNQEPLPPLNNHHHHHPLSIFLSSPSNGHQNASSSVGDTARTTGPSSEADDEERECPICLENGRVVKLNAGLEPSIFLDCDSSLSMCAFDPCGHMASARTVSYWSRVPIPHGTNAFNTMCPFCGVSCKGCVRLIFQDSID